MGQPHSALLVIDRAIVSDQDRSTFTASTPRTSAQYRRITTGGASTRRFARVEGLHASGWVIIGGLAAGPPSHSDPPGKGRCRR